MLILALDCSTARGTLALADFTMRPCWHAEITAGRGHGGALFTALEQAIGEVRKAGERLGKIIVGLGPGSYSGVRQAIAAAVGLAEATGAVLVGVPSAAALAKTPRYYQTVGDARRGTFYHSAVRDGCCVSGPDLLPHAAALENRLAERSDWPVFAVESLPDGVLPDAPISWPDATRMFGIRADDLIRPPLEPIYLRPVNITLPNAAKSAAP